jgi:hypothetical protein
LPLARRRKVLRCVGGQAFADGSEPIFEVLSKFGKVGGWFVGGVLNSGGTRFG